jgi:hypothetical protein
MDGDRRERSRGQGGNRVESSDGCLRWKEYGGKWKVRRQMGRTKSDGVEQMSGRGEGGVSKDLN